MLRNIGEPHPRKLAHETGEPMSISPISKMVIT